MSQQITLQQVTGFLCHFPEYSSYLFEEATSPLWNLVLRGLFPLLKVDTNVNPFPSNEESLLQYSLSCTEKRASVLETGALLASKSSSWVGGGCHKDPCSGDICCHQKTNNHSAGKCDSPCECYPAPVPQNFRVFFFNQTPRGSVQT